MLLHPSLIFCFFRIHLSSEQSFIKNILLIDYANWKPLAMGLLYLPFLGKYDS
jgi:hypothetical protein